MFFSAAVCCLIFSFDFSSASNFKNWKLYKPEKNLTNPKETTTPDINETEKPENFIKRSDLEELANIKNRYVVKNHIEDFETHYGLHFSPDWSQVNAYQSPARQNVDIRRQRWQFIFAKMNDTFDVQNLKSLLKEAGINVTKFCNDIAEAYFVLSDNAYIFDKDPNSDKKSKHFESVGDPLKQKSVQIFVKFVSTPGIAWDKKEEMVQIPKSVYIDLMRKDVHTKLLKNRNKKREELIIQNLKNKHKKTVDEIRFMVGDDIVPSRLNEIDDPNVSNISPF